MFKHVCRIMVSILALGAVPTALADFECPKLTGINGLKITAKDNHLSLNRAFNPNKQLAICAALDEPFKLKIINPNSSDYQVVAGAVTAVQKTDSPYLISGDNSYDKDYLEITVTEGSGEMGNNDDCGQGSWDDGCAGFDIIVDGLGKLDPKVRVVDNTIAMINDYETLVEVFEDLGLELEDVNKLFRHFGVESD